MICLLHPRLPIQTPSFLCDKKNTAIVIISSQEDMKKEVWTKAAPLEIAPSGIYLQMHDDCLLLGYPEGVLEIIGP